MGYFECILRYFVIPKQAAEDLDPLFLHETFAFKWSWISAIKSLDLSCPSVRAAIIHQTAHMMSVAKQVKSLIRKSG